MHHLKCGVLAMVFVRCLVVVCFCVYMTLIMKSILVR